MADVVDRMLLRPAPESNAERQRRFRARHPGYNKKYNGRPSAAAMLEYHRKMEAQRQLILRSTICKPLPLMLPAPVETIEFSIPRAVEKIPAFASAAMLRAA